MRPLTRRELALRLAATAAGAGGLALAPGPAAAQQRLVEGRDFIRLDRPAQVPSDGHVHVVEFFWYGCPHCNAFEPSLEAWVAKLPADVRFRRVPYDYDEALRENHARIFCVLEALGRVDDLQAKVFDRFHRQHRPIDDLATMTDFAHDNGLDVARVRAAWNSFTTDTRLKEYKAECKAYGVDFVPLLGIQGRFLTTPRADSDATRALVATDTLINLVRRGG